MTDYLYTEIINYLYLKLPGYLSRYYPLDKVDLDEIISETMFRCSLKYNSFRHESKVTTWAFGFARYVAMGYYHKRKTIYKNTCLLEDNIIYLNESPNSLLHKKQLVYDIRIAFHTLDFIHKRLVYLYVIKEIPKYQIYKQLNINKVAFDSLYKEAISLMKKEFIKVHYNVSLTNIPFY